MRTGTCSFRLERATLRNCCSSWADSRRTFLSIAREPNSKRFAPHTQMRAHSVVRRGSDEVLQVEQGSLYPALHRLIKRRWIAVEDGTSENNRRAKFYRLTAKGRKQLAVETSKWDALARAIARILRPLTDEGRP